MMFKNKYGRLPLVNQKQGAPDESERHEYDDEGLYELADADQDPRYLWALTSRREDVIEYFEKGVVE